MADWMDSFLANEKSLDSAKETDALLMGFAIACTPAMTKRLVDQLEKDVKKYAAAKSDPIRISPYGHGAHIIRDGNHPTMLLTLSMDAKNPLIHCESETRENSDSEDVRKSYDIHIVAEKQNNCFYRINGKKLNESETSAAILTPLLKLLRC